MQGIVEPNSKASFIRVYLLLQSTYVVYIIECGDRSLYTGDTNDLKRRFAQHQQGKGDITPPPKAVKILYTESAPTAQRR